MPTAKQPAQPAPASAAALGKVASTLLIPLAARAHGDALFPRLALGDDSARQVLAALGQDAAAAASAVLADRASVYAVLSRSSIFRERARDFFGVHPAATGACLGAGLGHYFQWLDGGANRWLDADLPEVTALREQLLPATGRRRINVALDLSQPGWWLRLGLPSRQRSTRAARPVLLLCEGVLMYLTPAQVHAVLHEVGEHAPAGSRLLLDAVHRLAVGRAHYNPSVRRTGAQFLWGPRHWQELTAAHPRLRIDGSHAVMQGYGWPYGGFNAAFQALAGMPPYAVAEIGIGA